MLSALSIISIVLSILATILSIVTAVLSFWKRSKLELLISLAGQISNTLGGVPDIVFTLAFRKTGGQKTQVIISECRATIKRRSDGKTWDLPWFWDFGRKEYVHPIALRGEEFYALRVGFQELKNRQAVRIALDNWYRELGESLDDPAARDRLNWAREVIETREGFEHLPDLEKLDSDDARRIAVESLTALGKSRRLQAWTRIGESTNSTPLHKKPNLLPYVEGKYDITITVHDERGRPILSKAIFLEIDSALALKLGREFNTRPNVEFQIPGSSDLAASPQSNK